MADSLKTFRLFLLIIAGAVTLLIARNWAYVTTYRLYLTHRADAAAFSAATQRFEIEGARVVPQITLRDEDRVAFPIEVRRPSTLHVVIRPAGRARYEVHQRRGTDDRLLASGDVTAPVTIEPSVTIGQGVLEVISRGTLTLVDPRLVRDLRFVPHVLVLGFLLIVWFIIGRLGGPRGPTTARARRAWFRAAALTASGTLTLAILEVGLRALGDRVPSGIAAERHDLGEVRTDSRWQDSRRYGRRLRPSVNAVNEWRDGDIVRMGYIPAADGGRPLHRFFFRTDEEGFRNARTRERIDIAALGDSFTDAMTLPIEDAWTSVFERRTGLRVQNYGTAGFGPQQELRVLKEYAVRHRPRVIVLAYFAGNDLFDAEAFDEFERSEGAIGRPAPGWQIKDVVSRADTWFVVSALRAAARWASAHDTPLASVAAAEPASRYPVRTQGPTFDRGRFTVEVGGHVLQWAFMPPYLNTLNFSERDLSLRKGWALTRQTLIEMQRVARTSGAQLVVMFVPFKSQVYLPLLERRFTPEQLAAAVRYYLPDSPAPPDVAAMSAHRLAQNALMRRFCAGAGIPFLDTTGALQARVEAGEGVYFPDESHFNEAGHALVAELLRLFLADLH